MIISFEMDAEDGELSGTRKRGRPNRRYMDAMRERERGERETEIQREIERREERERRERQRERERGGERQRDVDRVRERR